VAPIDKLSVVIVAILAVVLLGMSEGMSPYEMYYVLATDEEIRRLNELMP
jgi:uncharacterized membrane protein